MFEFRSFIAFFDRVFFKEESVYTASFFRIVWFSLLLLSALFEFGNLQRFYGPESVISLETVLSQFAHPHANVFHLFSNTSATVSTLYLLYVVALFFSLIGFKTRTFMIISLILITSFHQRNIWLLSSSEVLMRITTIYLIFIPCGNRYSVDYYLSKNKGNELPYNFSPWALRLIQIQLSVVYLSTVWQKLHGQTWFDGTALYYASRLTAMVNYPVPYLLDSMFWIRMLTWGTLIIETMVAIFLWFKFSRKWMIIIGIIFHLGIEYMMSIPFFEWVMIALLLAFLEENEVIKITNQFKKIFKFNNFKSLFSQK